jgi:competence protein ComEC
MTHPSQPPAANPPSTGPADPEPAAPPESGVDLRLVPGAAAAWAATYAAVGWPAGPSYAMAAAGLLLTVVALMAGRRWSLVFAGALGCAAAALLITGLRVAARDASPLAGLARQHASVDAVLVVRDDPRPLAAHGRGGARQVLVRAEIREVRTATAAWRLSARVLLFGPADSWRGLLPSQQVSARGRLGPALGGDLTVAVLSVTGPPTDPAPPSWPQRAAGDLRAGLRTAATGLPGGADGLLPGLVVGDTARLDPGIDDDFRTAGLTHLTAVSGANLAIVSGAALLLCRLIGAGPRLSALAAGIAMVGFVILARPSPSVLRAAAMGGVALAALAAGRPRAALPALSGSVLILVLWQPDLARSPGFALSVLATAALVVLAPQWTVRLHHRGVPATPAGALATAAAAGILTAPVIAALGGAVSTVAIPANLLAAPAVPPATVLGVLAALISPLWPAAAHAIAWLAALPAAWIVLVAGHAAHLPAAAVPWPAGPLGGATLAAVLAVTWWVLRHHRLRRLALAACTGAALVLLPAQVAAPGWPPAGWLLVACDVGQGDALVVAAGEGAAIVVDTGPDPAAVDACLRRLGVRRIPLVVLTHLHADHVGGLPGVLRGRTVGAVELGPLHEPEWAWRAVQDEAAAAGVPVVAGAAGEVREVAGVRLTVLAPGSAFHGTRSDPNNSSLVLRVVARGHPMLLTGDAEIEAQQALLRDDPVDLPAEILKVPHHGSAYSSPEFLAAVHAHLAVISVGAGNDYGHPAAGLLAALGRLGVRTVRTDQAGDIAIRDRGGTLEVVTHRTTAAGTGAGAHR